MSAADPARTAPFPAPLTVTAHSWRVACDGHEGAALGHPRVWLSIPRDSGWVDCGYCDTRFVIDPAHVADDH